MQEMLFLFCSNFFSAFQSIPLVKYWKLSYSLRNKSIIEQAEIESAILTL